MRSESLNGLSTEASSNERMSMRESGRVSSSASSLNKTGEDLRGFGSVWICLLELFEDGSSMEDNVIEGMIGN